MSGKKSTGNIAVDCMLAIEDAGFPLGQKISSKDMLLALQIATRQENKVEENRPITEIFIAELRQILADPRPTSTQLIIAKTQESIDEIIQGGQAYSDEGMKRISVLSYTLSMLNAQLKEESKNN